MFRTTPKPAGRPNSVRSRRRRPWGFQPALEALGERIAPAISASFSPSTHVLTVVGDAGNNAITIARNTAGRIFVNGATVAVAGGTPTVANTTLIRMFGLDGNDTLRLNEA